jgi:hypothetical protein
MKRFTVRWHEKLVLAAIILSCGLVLQADPPAHKHAKNVSNPGRNWRSDTGTHAAQQMRTAKLNKVRDQVASR